MSLHGTFDTCRPPMAISASNRPERPISEVADAWIARVFGLVLVGHDTLDK
jgi:hypothetical protein